MSSRPPADVEAAWNRRIALFGITCNDLGLGNKYAEADEDAKRHQARHRWTTRIGAFSGTLAILIGAVQLGRPFWEAGAHGHAPHWSARALALVCQGLTAVTHHAMAAELGLIVLTLICVFYGHYAHNHHEWLLRRYVAERYRSMPFQILISPPLWRTDEPVPRELKDIVSRDMEDLAEAHREGLNELARRDEAPRIPRPEACAEADPALTARLLQHYLDRRLTPQIRYFEDALEKQKGRIFENPVFLPVFFLASMSFVLLHLAFEIGHGLLGEGGHGDLGQTFEGLSALMLLVSVAIPISWAGIRTWRAANEFSRNTARSHARLALLHRYATELKPEAPAPPPDAFDVFRVLALTEALLRNELQEWLRLMVEAEWY